MKRASVTVSFACLGAASSVWQTLVVREALAVTSGSEAVVAVVFGVWLMHTAAGAYLGKLGSARPWVVAVGFVGYGLAATLTMLLGRFACTVLALGQTPTLPTLTLACVVLLAPTCVLGGWLYCRLFRHACSINSAASTATASRVAYALDSIGGALGAIPAALWLLDRWLPFSVLAVVVGLVVVAAALLVATQRRALVLTAAAGLALVNLLAFCRIDERTYRWHAPEQTIVEARSSNRGALLVTEHALQNQILLQRQPLFVSSDYSAAEQLAHLPAALHEHPGRILVLGVGPGDFLAQLRTHPVQSIDVVVGDAQISQLLLRYAPGANDKAVHLVAQDERVYVRKTPSQPYDLAYVLGSAPTSVAQARLFSREFYQHLATIVAPRALVVVALPGFAAFATDAEQRFHASVASTLQSVFEHVLLIPADQTLYIASNDPVTNAADLASVIESTLRQRGISSEVLTATWLRDRLSPRRMDQVTRWARHAVEPSTDAHPIVYRAALRHALDRLGDSSQPVLLVLLVSLAAVLVLWLNPLRRPVSFCVVTTGYGGLSAQLVIMLTYQTVVGVLYRDVALLSASFLLASCFGALCLDCFGTNVANAGLVRGQRSVMFANLLQLGLIVALACTTGLMMQASTPVAQTMMFIGSSAVGFTTGFQIAVASTVPAVFGPHVGATVYGLDVLGGAVAALATVSVLIPALGITGALWIVVALKAASAGALFLRARSPSRPSCEERPLRIALPAFAVAAVVMAMVDPQFQLWMTSWTGTSAYHAIVWLLLLAVLLAGYEPSSVREFRVRFERRLSRVAWRIGISPLRLLVFLGLLPVASMPLGKCYFTVPYVMCHACPNPCVFGIVRRYVIVVALLANVGDERFCMRACPLGLAQQSLASMSTGSVPAPKRALEVVRWLAFVAVVVLYIGGLPGSGSAFDSGMGSIYQAVFINGYATSIGVVVLVALFLLVSLKVRRPLCRSLCPIGAATGVLHGATKKLLPVISNRSGS